ncbi:hypothetical protein [Chromobacterium amazonense]|nr:hypothetical protein [Chromobacterium amazonense]
MKRMTICLGGWCLGMSAQVFAAATPCAATPEFVAALAVPPGMKEDGAMMPQVMAAIAAAKAQPADPIRLGAGAPSTLWLALDDPDAAAVTEEAVAAGGQLTLRLMALAGQTPAKAALLHMVLEQQPLAPAALPDLVRRFQQGDVLALSAQYPALSLCARTAAQLRVEADAALAQQTLRRLDRTVWQTKETR